jgi:hypothetical protein
MPSRLAEGSRKLNCKCLQPWGALPEAVVLACDVAHMCMRTKLKFSRLSSYNLRLVYLIANRRQWSACVSMFELGAKTLSFWDATTCCARTDAIVLPWHLPSQRQTPQGALRDTEFCKLDWPRSIDNLQVHPLLHGIWHGFRHPSCLKVQSHPSAADSRMKWPR